MPSLGFKGYLTSLKLDRGKITKEVERRANKLNKEAAREYVRAVILHVPVYTGMARGSIKLAKGRSGEAAGYSLYQFLKLNIPINPVGHRPKKNPEAGGKQGRFTFSHYKGRYNFTINTSVTHYLINEFMEPNGRPSFTKPWHSFAAGEKAYNDHFKAHAHEVIPRLSDYIVRTKVTLG